MSSRLKSGDKEIIVSNLDRVLWPESGFTKYDLIYYYTSISQFLLPHLKNRLLVLQRFPAGIQEDGFYQKNSPPKTPEYVRRVPFSHNDGKISSYIVVDNIESLIWLGNQAAIELHPWLSSLDTIDCPDYAVFDLDPMENSTFDDVRETALTLKDILDKLELKSFPKTSGATGMQVYVPIKPVYSYNDVRNFCEVVCQVIQEYLPDKTTLERSVNRRKGKLYLDYLQNVQGKTLAAPYSPRPHPGAPVSMPLEWEEVRDLQFKPVDFNISNALARVKERGDAFLGVLNGSQNLPSI